MCAFPVTDGVKFDYFFKVMVVRFLYCKGAISPICY